MMARSRRATLVAAREHIAKLRQALVECHTHPVTGKLDDLGADAVAEDDAVLALIDADLAEGESDPDVQPVRTQLPLTEVRSIVTAITGSNRFTETELLIVRATERAHHVEAPPVSDGSTS